MSDVKRLKVTIKTNEGGYATGVELAEDPSGGLVLAKDYDALAAKLDKAHRALMSLTPGGSEFHEDPDRCVQFVKDTRNSMDRIAKDAIYARRAAEEKHAALSESHGRLVEVVEQAQKCGALRATVACRSDREQDLALDAVNAALAHARTLEPRKPEDTNDKPKCPCVECSGYAQESEVKEPRP